MLEDDPNTRRAPAEQAAIVATLQAFADEHIRVPAAELPSDTRVAISSLGRGNYVRLERRRLRPNKHWVRFDGSGGAEIALTAKSMVTRFKGEVVEEWEVVLDGQVTVIAPALGEAAFVVTLRPGMALLDLHEAAALLAGGIPPQCVQFSYSDTDELMPALDSEAAALRLVSGCWVHEGTQLVLSTIEPAGVETEEGALGLPMGTRPGHAAVARLRRRRLGMGADVEEADVLRFMKMKFHRTSSGTSAAIMNDGSAHSIMNLQFLRYPTKAAQLSALLAKSYTSSRCLTYHMWGSLTDMPAWNAIEFTNVRIEGNDVTADVTRHFVSSILELGTDWANYPQVSEQKRAEIDLSIWRTHQRPNGEPWGRTGRAKGKATWCQKRALCDHHELLGSPDCTDCASWLSLHEWNLRLDVREWDGPPGTMWSADTYVFAIALNGDLHGFVHSKHELSQYGRKGMHPLFMTESRK
eukprot:SAG22_NODE_876_length_6716_cov_2.126190_2_plen_468_part_00